jgi:hypothetical protein
LRISDKDHIAKVKKTTNLEVNGQAINNTFQAVRIGTGLLAEYRDADFFYTWSSTREALLFEEGDVVAIIDAGAGVVNLPVMIQAISLDPGNAGLPKVSFTAQKFSNYLYDDSINERIVPIVIESAVADETLPTTPTSLGTTVIDDTEIDLSWTPSTDVGSGIATYILRRATDSGFTTGVTDIDVGNVSSYNDTGLTAATTYYYKIKAVDNAGNSSAYSSAVNDTTTGSAGDAALFGGDNLLFGGDALKFNP